MTPNQLADELDRLKHLEETTPDGEPNNMGESWHDYVGCFLDHHAEIIAALRAVAQEGRALDLLAKLYEWCRGCNDFRLDSPLARDVRDALTPSATPHADGQT